MTRPVILVSLLTAGFSGPWGCAAIAQAILPPSVLAPFVQAEKPTPAEEPDITLPSALPAADFPLRQGAVRLPPLENLGPPGGLTLDQAIARLVQVNPTLRAALRRSPRPRPTSSRRACSPTRWSSPSPRTFRMEATLPRSPEITRMV